MNVSQGSGQALLDALTRFANRSQHPEIANAPLFLWGMSAGGQFNYEFMAWKPERVAAFVVNKGGIYYSALVSSAARDVPGILFVGGKDLEFRTNTIVGLFAVNRRGGALWALAEEPAAAHIVGRSRDMALIFFEDVHSAAPRRPAEYAQAADGEDRFHRRLQGEDVSTDGRRSRAGLSYRVAAYRAGRAGLAGARVGKAF